MANKENLRKWVAKLRDPQYKQGRGTLCFTSKEGEELHCCLDIAILAAIDDGLPVVREQGTHRSKVTSSDGSSSSLPASVQRWLGIDESNPELKAFPTSDVTLSASVLNDADKYRYTFAQIADAVERTYNLKDDDNAD